MAVSEKVVFRGGKVEVVRRVYSGANIQLLKDMRCFGVLAEKKEINLRSDASVYRSRKKIREILQMNVVSGSWFLTLTYADDIKDYDVAYKDFKKYVMRLRYNDFDIRYLAIKEHTAKGRLHFHLVVFNDYNDLEIQQVCDLWGKGFTYHKCISDISNIESITRYLSAYFIKNDNPLSFNKKMYFTSKNIKRVETVSHLLLYDYVNSKQRALVQFKLDKMLHQVTALKDIDIVDFAKFCFGIDKVKVI